MTHVTDKVYYRQTTALLETVWRLRVKVHREQYLTLAVKQALSDKLRETYVILTELREQVEHEIHDNN